MKKLLITLALLTVLSTPAFAGPIDWMMDKVGYTPTAQIINERQQAELEKLKLQAQIAELQIQQKTLESKATRRLFLLISVFSTIALVIYGRYRQRINQALAEIRVRSERVFGKKEISAGSGSEVTT